MNFPAQVTLATIVVSACVAGLVFVGRSSAPQGLSDDPVEVLREPSSARALVPASAWLVADFPGDLAGRAPFFDQAGPCKQVPPPKRVAVAILPPTAGRGPDLLILAPQVEDRFWTCVVAKIEQAGGTPLAENERFQVLKSPTGVVARGPGKTTVFVSSDSHLELALSVLSDLAPGAAAVGPHAALYRRMHPNGEKSSQLDITLALPENWLASVGQDASKSPLRHIQAAFVSSHRDGSAVGGVDCQEAGCPEVLAFLIRAKADLVRELPQATKQVIGDSLTARHIQGAGQIAIRWSSSQMPLGRLLGQFFDSTPKSPQ